MIVIPAITFGIVIALQLIMLLLNAAALALHGASPAILATDVPLARMSVILLYGLVTLTLWYAPIHGWILLVSAWSRRATFLWAALPPLGLCLLEKIAFDSSTFARLLGHRIGGAFEEAFTVPPHTRMAVDLSMLDPVGFFSSPGLWGGLMFAAVFLAAAVWLRRHREPI
jgi:ABC-2 type transport system permease protein